MKVSYLILLIVFFSILIRVVIVKNRKKLDKNDDIVNMLRQPIQYKDNTVAIYSPFDEKRIPAIKSSFDELESHYFRINEDNEFEFKENEGEDLNKIKKYFEDQDIYINQLDEEKETALNLYLDSTYPIFKNFLLKRINPIYEYPDMLERAKNRFNLIRKELKDPRLIMNKVSSILNQVIYNAPKLPIPLTVFRGTSSDPNFLQELRMDKNGNYIYDIKSFMSTSILHNVPAGLNHYFINLETKCCMWIIYLPANIKALYIQKNELAPGAGEEFEMLLPVGGKLKLLEATKKYTKYDIATDDLDKDVRLFTPKIDTYIWEYIPPDSNDYNIELFYYKY
jgi:hypothetical protein